ncbi:hypothetical protein Q8A67_018983 [Cirrhinus molitorella]|uniref:Uncharacterized protein n=1 Tax=Cirrhinus molitorella TaxID=172907 RepID=A0AA88TRA4_9TELE|nr:hypothetical protein Q8A67_018983 [Cirrhinus molitorella]
MSSGEARCLNADGPADFSVSEPGATDEENGQKADVMELKLNFFSIVILQLLFDCSSALQTDKMKMQRRRGTEREGKRVRSGQEMKPCGEIRFS